MKATVMKENLDWKCIGECSLNLDTLLEKEAFDDFSRIGVFYGHLRKYFVLSMSKKQLKQVNTICRGFKTTRKVNSSLSNNKIWVRKREVTFSNQIPQEIVEEINRAVEGNENLNYGVYEFLLTQNGYTLIYIV